MNDALVVSMLSIVLKHPVAPGMGGMSAIRLPAWTHRALVRWFLEKCRTGPPECDGDADELSTLAELVIRPLPEGMRPVEMDPDIVVSPIDARAHTFGRIEDGMFLRADGKPARAAQLLDADVLRLPRLRRRHRGALRWRPLRRAVPLAGGLPPGPHATRGHSRGSASPARPVVARLPRRHPQGRRLVRPQCQGSTVILIVEPGRIGWRLEPGQVVRLARPITRRASSAETIGDM